MKRLIVAQLAALAAFLESGVSIKNRILDEIKETVPNLTKEKKPLPGATKRRWRALRVIAAIEDRMFLKPDATAPASVAAGGLLHDRGRIFGRVDGERHFCRWYRRPHTMPHFLATVRVDGGKRFFRERTREAALERGPFMVEEINGFGQVKHRERFDAPPKAA
jgi:hypothetical protein